MTATLPAEDLAAFGQAIKSALGRRQQSWLAKEMGVSPPTITDWKKGNFAPETPERVFKLERVLGVPPGHLSQHLGYVPVRERSAPSLVEAVRSDPSISDINRNTLLALLTSWGVITE